MGAVSGFTGPPDTALAKTMQSTLRHRGGHDVNFQSASTTSLALRYPHGGLRIGCVHPAIHTFPEENLSIAMCGWLTSIDDPQLATAASSPSPSSEAFYRELARSYRHGGTAFLQHLRGAFILVIADRSTLHVARDASGNRTVFYGSLGERWLFGIEPKAITAAPGFPRQIRPAALAQYLACSFVPGSGTMLENLYELPAGNVVSLTQGKPAQLRRWFCFEEDEPEEADNGRADDTIVVREFQAEMERAVAERIPRDEPLGVFLSGGLDSSIVTAELARQVGGRRIRTWAIHFGPGYPNELEFARAVAQRCGTIHEEVLIQPRQFLPRLRRMIWHLDDPIGDPITQPNFELAAYVADDVRFIFNGEGGDPCFGGPKNIPMMLHHWYGGLQRGATFREQHYLASYRRAWDEIQWLLSDDVQRQIDIERDLEGVFAPYLNTVRPRLFLNRLIAINIREKGAHLIQPKVERMLGAHGITPLAPLFDEQLIRFSFRMPARMKLHGGIEKVVLKRAYERYLPDQVIQRPKSGMRVPVQYWFRGEMRRYARKILSRRSVRSVGLFNADRVQQLLNYDIAEGRGRYGLRLWMLITFELWRRLVVQGEDV